MYLQGFRRRGLSSVLAWALLVVAHTTLPAVTIGIAPQDGGDATAYNAKGLALYGSGKYEEAAGAYKQAIRLKKDYAEAHYNLGDAYLMLGQFKKAIESYKQSVRHKPDSAVAYNNMGAAYYKLGDHKKSVESFKEAIRLDPKLLSAYYSLGSVYLAGGDQKKALEQYQILKTLDPKTADKLYLLIYKPSATIFNSGGLGEVRLNVSVADSDGSPVLDLKQEEIRVFEDTVPQTISFFSKEEAPLVYALVVDISGSFEAEIDQAVKAAMAVIENNQPTDEATVVGFSGSGNIVVIQDFTADKAALKEAVDSLYAEPGPTVIDSKAESNQTAIIDAVYLTAQRVTQYKVDDGTYRRRAVILITDGDERASYYSLDDLVGELRKLDVQIFVISLNMKSSKSTELNRDVPKRWVELLTKFSKETGGQASFPNTISELQRVANQMLKALRTQYSIAYKPVNPGTAGAYRSVVVSLADRPGAAKRTLITRPGYVIPEKH